MIELHHFGSYLARIDPDDSERPGVLIAPDPSTDVKVPEVIWRYVPGLGMACTSDISLHDADWTTAIAALRARGMEPMSSEAELVDVEGRPMHLLRWVTT